LQNYQKKIYFPLNLGLSFFLPVFDLLTGFLGRKGHFREKIKKIKREDMSAPIGPCSSINSISNFQSFMQQSGNFCHHCVKVLSPYLQDKRISFVILFATEVAFFKLVDKVCYLIEDKIMEHEYIRAHHIIKIALGMRFFFIMTYIGGSIVLSKYFPNPFKRTILAAISVGAFVFSLASFKTKHKQGVSFV
jgi:hypothetical protein